jgi:hypothetical protein
MVAVVVPVWLDLMQLSRQADPEDQDILGHILVTYTVAVAVVV